ncbi:MAG: DUF4920 domain-containing protein [Saprospiraceae bacterium]
MVKKFALALASAALLAACGGTQAPPTSNADGSQNFGAAVTADNAITYEALRPKMGNTDSLAIKVTGTVGEVCQKKGCWMMLVSDQPGTPEMRVTFKDYAFFMPKDLTGKRVVLDGFAFISETSVDDLRHYAEDAGKTPEEIAAITQPEREVAFEAAGVLIIK